MMNHVFSRGPDGANAPKTVFVVDDNDANLIRAGKALSDDYRVFTMPSAPAMFELLADVSPDLILLDIMMPEMNGFETLKLLKADTRYTDIPIVFLTARNDPAAEAFSFEIGATDFISKPFSASVLLNRIRAHLEVEGLIRERTAMLRQRTEKLQKLQNSMVSVLANMAENRDKLTGRHIERTTKFIKILLEAMTRRGVYADELDKWNLELVASSSRLRDLSVMVFADYARQCSLEVVILSARLHDIGKIAISDLILNKPAKLTPDEYELMKTHTSEGEKIIDSIISESGDESFFHNARLFAGAHHERRDGTGYPCGLKGAEIPLQGRIMAVVDVYDALVSDRPYKNAYPHEQAVEIIRESSGSHFDPKIADTFLAVHDSFAEVNRCR